MTKLAPEWVQTSDPVISSPARYRWTTAPAPYQQLKLSTGIYIIYAMYVSIYYLVMQILVYVLH